MLARPIFHFLNFGFKFFPYERVEPFGSHRLRLHAYIFQLLPNCWIFQGARYLGIDLSMMARGVFAGACGVA